MDYTCVCGKRQRQETPLKKFTEDDLCVDHKHEIDAQWLKGDTTKYLDKDLHLLTWQHIKPNGDS